MRFSMTRGPTIFRAPENDEGADYGEDEGQGGEGPEDDAQEDDEGDEGLDVEDEADQGQDDDDGADEGQEPQGRQAQVGKTRGANRVAEATRIAAEAKREAAESKRELEQFRREQSQRQNQESQAQRQERLSLMDPEQRTEYLLNEQAQNFQGQLNAIRFEAQNSADRTAFEGLCARSPVAAKHAAEVETELTRLRSTGNNYAREVVLKYLIGEKALAAQPRAKGKQEREAAANRQRQSARPGRSGSDVASDSGRGGSEAQRRAKRLDGMQI